MNYKLLLLLVLLLSISLYSVRTGWISSETMEYIYVTVVTTEVDLTVTTDKTEYCPGDLINVSNNLTNLGSSNVTGNLTSRILDPSSFELNSTNWFDIDLLVGESKIYNAYYEVQGNETATDGYVADGNFSYDEEFDYSSDTFRIKIGIGNFLVLPNSISQAIPAGNSSTEQIQFWLQYACDNATVTFNITPGPPGEWTNITPEEVFLLYTGIGNTTTVNISVPYTANTGIYNGTISVYANGVWQSNISLTVTVTEAAFSLDVTIPSENKQVCPGEEVPAVIEISKNFTGVVDINMSYQIRDSIGYVYAEMNETLQLNESLQRTTVLNAPSSSGQYMFFSILQHNSTVVSAYDTFEVVQCLPPRKPPTRYLPPVPIPIYEIILRLSTNILTVIRRNRTSFIAYVNNTGNYTVEDIRLSIEGIPLTWIEVLPMQVSILPGQTTNYLVVINVPEDAETGIRRLFVKAKDDVESNTEILTLVIGRDPKEIADLLLTELERVRILAMESLSVEDCLDIAIIKSYYQDAEFARERGLEEYNLKNFVDSIKWFEYAIPVYEEVVSRVDITVELEIELTNTSRFIIPPIFDPDKQFVLAESYLSEKKYQEICDPIVNIRNYIMIGLIFWPVLAFIIIILIIIAVVVYAKKRKIDREKIMKRVRKRLGFGERKTYL